MLQIHNGLYKSIAIDWSNITLPLNAGTPVSLAGAVANNANAVGIVPQAYKEVPLMPEIYVLIGGDVDLEECEETYGDSYDEAAIAAMDGIRFYTEDGTPVDNSEVAKIKANVKAIEPDAVIKYVCDETEETYAPVLACGTYESLAAKIDFDDDLPLNVVCGNALLTNWSAEEGYISLVFAVPAIDDGDVVWNTSSLYVLADGSISTEEPSSDDSGNDDSAPA